MGNLCAGGAAKAAQLRELDHALQDSDANMMSSLLLQSPALLRAPHGESHGVLIHSAVEHGHQAMLQELLSFVIDKRYVHACTCMRQGRSRGQAMALACRK
jgi:hypothetical protein